MTQILWIVSYLPISRKTFFLGKNHEIWNFCKISYMCHGMVITASKGNFGVQRIWFKIFSWFFAFFHAFLQPKRPISKFRKNRKNHDFRQNMTFPTNERYGLICIYMTENGPLGSQKHIFKHKSFSTSFRVNFTKNQFLRFFRPKFSKNRPKCPPISGSWPIFGRKFSKSIYND